MKKNIREVKRFQKPLICLIVMLVSVISYTTGKFINAKADDVSYDYLSSEIGYDSTGNSLNATNVKDAIDELYGKVGQCPKGLECISNENLNKINITHSTIVNAYTYDENSCITGEEENCKKTICYLSKNKNACLVGTIIDYKVNDETTVRFHVLHDDGETMTMQAQSNTVYNVAWWSEGNDPTKGPQTIMGALKTATDDWTNVNPITITSGTTSFTGVESIDNLCTNNNDGIVSCSGNVYDIGLIANTYRARMITLQEATDPNVGQCLPWVSDSQTNAKSCRMFMNNYLYDIKKSVYCRNVGLCVEDDHTENGADHNWGYWTMGAFSSNLAWNVYRNGYVHGYATSYIHRGARAVVTVNK